MRQRLTCLVLLALLVRALVPAGFMLAPVTATSLGFTVVICTEHGPQEIVLDEGETDPRQPQPSHETCPFALSALLGLASEATLLTAAVEYASVTYASARLLFSLTPQPGAASARGPPALA